jgi:hypothetical protein
MTRVISIKISAIGRGRLVLYFDLLLGLLATCCVDLAATLYLEPPRKLCMYKPPSIGNDLLINHDLYTLM